MASKLVVVGENEYSVPVRGTIMVRTVGVGGSWRQTDTSVTGASLHTPIDGSTLRREAVDAILAVVRS